MATAHLPHLADPDVLKALHGRSLLLTRDWSRRELETLLPGLRVVLMTGSDETGEVPWPVVTKPFDLRSLVSLVVGRRP